MLISAALAVITYFRPHDVTLRLAGFSVEQACPISHIGLYMPGIAMYLIQIFLPLYRNDGARLAKALYDQVTHELMQKFGGLTAYSQAPASGLWKEESGNSVHDDLVIYEVMSEQLDKGWWSGYRADLEKRFMQKSLVVRAHQICVL